MSSRAPQIKKGWMKKQGRSGVVKNWKKRFFVLHDGKVSYYTDEIENHPYGDGFKVFMQHSSSLTLFTSVLIIFVLFWYLLGRYDAC